jgi:hypothetical protein
MVRTGIELSFEGKKDWKQRTRWTQARRTQQFSDKTDQKHLISKKKVEVRMGLAKLLFDIE